MNILFGMKQSIDIQYNQYDITFITDTRYIENEFPAFIFIPP